MKALVISDSHGAVGNFLDVLEKHKDIKTIFFLGEERTMLRSSFSF